MSTLDSGFICTMRRTSSSCNAIRIAASCCTAPLHLFIKCNAPVIPSCIHKCCVPWLNRKANEYFHDGTVCSLIYDVLRQCCCAKLLIACSNEASYEQVDKKSGCMLYVCLILICGEGFAVRDFTLSILQVNCRNTTVLQHYELRIFCTIHKMAELGVFEFLIFHRLHRNGGGHCKCH